MTKKISLEIGRRREPVGGRRELLARRRLDDVGRHDDDQLRFLVLEVPAAEQRPEDWNILRTGQTIDVLLGLGADQTGKRQRAARRQFDNSFRLARIEDRVISDELRDVADAGVDLQADAPLRKNDRRKAQLHAELLEGHRGR